jgi:hypothetical protein
MTHARFYASCFMPLAPGRGLGFFLGPALVLSPDDLPRLLAVEAALAALPLICAIVYYPVLPIDPPSEAAVVEFRKFASAEVEANGESCAGVAAVDEGLRAKLTTVEVEDKAVPTVHSSSLSRTAAVAASLKRAAGDFLACVRSRGLVLLTLSGGLQMAVYGAWSGTLPSVVSPPFSVDQVMCNHQHAALMCHIRITYARRACLARSIPSPAWRAASPWVSPLTTRCCAPV